MAMDPAPHDTPPAKTPEELAKIRKDIRRNYIVIGILFVISSFLGAVIYAAELPPPPHLYDALARCIASSKTTFYGAFWCPDCAQQKTKFGTGAQYLPYHECSLPDHSENASCKSAGITHYPTWVFPDGSRLVGVQNPSTLAAKTGCPMPTST